MTKRFAFISGQDSTARRARVIELFKTGRLDVLIASTIVDEGFDAPNIRFLVLAGGGKAEHRQVQRLGRGMRVAEGKEQLVAVDFLDRGKYLGTHSRGRARAYRKERAYTVHELTASEFKGALG